MKVTDKFLGYLGIDSVDELPNYYEIKEKLNGKQGLINILQNLEEGSRRAVDKMIEEKR